MTKMFWLNELREVTVRLARVEQTGMKLQTGMS